MGFLILLLADLIVVRINRALNATWCLYDHLAHLLLLDVLHGLVEDHGSDVLCLVHVLLALGDAIHVKIAGCDLFGHSSMIMVFHSGLGCNRFSTNHHSAINSIVLVYRIRPPLLIDKGLRLILLLLLCLIEDLVIIAQVDLHILKLLLLLLHDQILNSALIDLNSIRCINPYLGSSSCN